jgi:hypothetical protein
MSRQVLSINTTSASRDKTLPERNAKPIARPTKTKNMKTFLEILWQVPVVVFAAEFVAGVVHWFEDAYIRENTPLIGKLVGRPNTIHHHFPRYMTRKIGGKVRGIWFCSPQFLSSSRGK